MAEHFNGRWRTPSPPAPLWGRCALSLLLSFFGQSVLSKSAGAGCVIETMTNRIFARSNKRRGPPGGAAPFCRLRASLVLAGRHHQEPRCVARRAGGVHAR
jgi:hypothetical protein